MKCIMFCKIIGGETAHHRCLVLYKHFTSIIQAVTHNYSKVVVVRSEAMHYFCLFLQLVLRMSGQYMKI